MVIVVGVCSVVVIAVVVVPLVPFTPEDGADLEWGDFDDLTVEFCWFLAATRLLSLSLFLVSPFPAVVAALSVPSSPSPPLVDSWSDMVACWRFNSSLLDPESARPEGAFCTCATAGTTLANRESCCESHDEIPDWDWLEASELASVGKAGCS